MHLNPEVKDQFQKNPEHLPVFPKSKDITKLQIPDVEMCGICLIYLPTFTIDLSF